MQYAIQKMIGDEDHVRYALIQRGKNTLYVLGLNPSTATDNKPDPTLRKIMGYAERNGFDGFVILNLYPERATQPNTLPSHPNKKYYDENLRIINELLSNGSQSPKILACFGDFVQQRSYLIQSWKDIVSIAAKHNAEWFCIGTNKSGMPKHPVRAAYCCFEAFSITNCR